MAAQPSGSGMILPINRSMVFSPTRTNANMGSTQPMFGPITTSPSKVNPLPPGPAPSSPGLTIPIQFGAIGTPQPSQPAKSVQVLPLGGITSPVRPSQSFNLAPFAPINPSVLPFRPFIPGTSGITEAFRPGPSTQPVPIISPLQSGPSTQPFQPFTGTSVSIQPFQPIGPTTSPGQTNQPFQPIGPTTLPFKLPQTQLGSTTMVLPLQPPSTPTTVSSFQPVIPLRLVDPIAPVFTQFNQPATPIPVRPSFSAPAGPLTLPGIKLDQIYPSALTNTGLFNPSTQVAASSFSRQELEQNYRPISVEELTVVLKEAAKRESTFIPNVVTMSSTVASRATPMSLPEAFAASGLPVITK